MRRISIALLFGILMVVIKTIPVYASTYVVAGVSYDDEKNCEFGDATLSEDGTLSVISMPEENLEAEKYVWYEYKNLIKKVVFDNSISEVNSSSFKDYTNIKEIELGTGVRKIEENAFSGCSELKLITGGENVESIADGAFYTESQSVPDNLTYLNTCNENLKNYDWFKFQNRKVCTDINYVMETTSKIEKMPVNYRFNNEEMKAVLKETYKIIGQEDYVIETELKPEDIELSTNLIEKGGENIIYVHFNYKNGLGKNEDLVNEVVIEGVENKPVAVEIPLEFNLKYDGEKFIGTEYLKVVGSDAEVNGIKVKAKTVINFDDKAAGTVEFGDDGEKLFPMSSIVNGVQEKITINVEKDMIYSIGDMNSEVQFEIITY